MEEEQTFDLKSEKIKNNIKNKRVVFGQIKNILSILHIFLSFFPLFFLVDKIGHGCIAHEPCDLEMNII